MSRHTAKKQQVEKQNSDGTIATHKAYKQKKQKRKAVAGKRKAAVGKKSMNVRKAKKARKARNKKHAKKRATKSQFRAKSMKFERN